MPPSSTAWVSGTRWWCTADGLDEISISDKSLVWDVTREKLSPHYEISPESFGFKKAKKSEIKGGTPAENAGALHRILDGSRGALRNAIVMNAAAALIAADFTSYIKEAVRLAEESIDSGLARDKLNKLVELSQRLE